MSSQLTAIHFLPAHSSFDNRRAYLPIQHAIAAIAGDSSEETTSFFDTHFSGIGPSSSGSSSSLHQDVPTTFETAADLVKSHVIDAVIFGSEVEEKYSLIEAALNAMTTSASASICLLGNQSARACKPNSIVDNL